MVSPGRAVVSLATLLLLGTQGVLAADVNVGYNAFSAAQDMINLASHSWEWGTAAEALLELYNPELSVFGPNPFPGGKIPNASDNTVSLVYARQFIDLNGDVFVGNSAVGDPASLGVSAVLLGQSNQAYLSASSRQANQILNVAPKFSNGAISQQTGTPEVWADFMFMAPPFRKWPLSYVIERC